ncbi:hypothetical protein AX14_005555 [Amanita brunnescens Koide BX004]|nr:hypothetical protein AX14_005555 [Amanita brunnescens Koide BX004]
MAGTNLTQLLGQTMSLSSLTELSMMEGFIANRRGLRSLIIGISARAWMQQSESTAGYPASAGNTALSNAFYRLSRLLEHPLVPVFVFDSISQASHKRGRQGQVAPQRQLAASFRHMVLAFGYNVHQAPAGAEEELAALCRNHLIDIVITDNIFTFMFGATHVIRDMEFLNSTDDMVKVYTSATEGQAHPGPLLSHGNWILLALLVGNAGGGHGPGLYGCGLSTALQIIKSDLGAGLLQAAEQSSLPQLQDFLQSWRHNLQHELADDPNRHLGRQCIALAQAVSESSFPSPDDIIHLIRPITSLSNGQLGPDTSLWVPRAPDLGRMGHICEAWFSWATGASVVREFDLHVWPGTCTRLLLTSIVFPADKQLTEHVNTIMTGVAHPQKCKLPKSESSIPKLHLTVSMHPLHAATLSQLLNVRNPTTPDSEPGPLLEKEISVPSAIVLQALPGIGERLDGLPPSSSSRPLLFPILREVDMGHCGSSKPSAVGTDGDNKDFEMYTIDCTEYLLE